MRAWEQLPETMRSETVKTYYLALKKKRFSLFFKRAFDIFASLLLLVLLWPVCLLIGIWIKCDSPGPVIFRQRRVTRYGRVFAIWKFRTMKVNAEQCGPSVTVREDTRITRSGHFLRRYRLDELPQLVNVLKGDMSFVGTRPEVERYVAAYTEEMMATLLLPAGITSDASVHFIHEDEMLSAAADADEVYIHEILPQKMAYNLRYLRDFSLWLDIKLMLTTVARVFHSADDETEGQGTV